MIVTLIFALLPIIVTICLGILAGKLGDFKKEDATKFTKLILKYALPMSIFNGILSTPRKIIIENLPLDGWILVAMVGTYIISYFIFKKFAKVNPMIKIFRALAYADPSVPFIGSAILPLLFAESIASIDIGISALLINVILLPIIFVQLSNFSGEHTSIWARVKATLSKPLVFSALIAFILALCGVKMPTLLSPTFTELGKISGGLAMFATGIILYTSDLKFTKQIGINVFCKNLVVPLVIWGLMVLFRMPSTTTRIVVVTLAIPTATMPSNLAIRYQEGEVEMAATQFYSTIAAVVTLSAFMLLLS